MVLHPVACRGGVNDSGIVNRSTQNRVFDIDNHLRTSLPRSLMNLLQAAITASLLSALQGWYHILQHFRPYLVGFLVTVTFCAQIGETKIPGGVWSTFMNRWLTLCKDHLKIVGF